MGQFNSDNELIRLISIGDREAFAHAYRTHVENLHGFIFSICYDKELTEEILQNLFLKIWENRAEMVHVLALKPYLFKCAKNQLLNHLKREKVREKSLKIITERTELFKNTTEDGLAYREYYALAMDAINLLPEKRKMIFKLRLHDERSLDEIAGHLKISKSVVKKQLYSGMSFVRKYLLKNGDIVALVLSTFLG